jgi:hypothetical protein
MSISTVIPSNLTALQDTVPTLPHSPEEDKSTRTPADKEGEDGRFTAIEEEDPDVGLAYPDGGWRAWGVVVGVSRFPPVDGMRI